MFVASNSWKDRGRSSFPPGGDSRGGPINLNFHNHCLLCLQHEDASVLEQIAQENPRGLHNFQAILQFLTGTVDPSSWGREDGGGNRSAKYYPVTSNLPPLCMLCYEILGELHMFYAELMELQRKIQNQTEAARRIVKGTTRRGGMRAEFFNRLKIAGCPKEEMEGMEYFIGNFHDLIVEADRKAVLPQLLPLTFNDLNFSSIDSSKETASLKPYFVQFADPQGSSKSPQIVSISSGGATSLPVLVSPEGGALPPTIFVALPEPELPPEPPQVEEDIVSTPGVTQFEYEGDDDEVDNQDKMENVEDDDIVVLDDEEETQEIEERPDLILEQVDEEETNQAPETDVNYWRNALSSLVTIEDVDEDDQREKQEGATNSEEIEDDDISIVEQPKKNIELIDLDDEEDEELSQEETEEEYLDFVDDDDAEIEYCTPGSPYSYRQPLVDSTTNPGTSRASTSKNVTKEPSHWCSICAKGYHSAQRLRHHELEHLPGGRPKPFGCKTCQKMFSSRNLLRQHERIHSDERPFECPICGSKFRQGSTLYRHKLTHKKANS